jgi:transcription antitermination factor NusG
MTAHWYAVHCHTRKEELVVQQLEMHGFTVFYPQIKVQPANPRSRTARPYFSGYVFVHADVAEVGISKFQYLPHALGLVCFGGVPADVPAQLLRAIERHLETINTAGGELFTRLKPGDRVEIRSGPFAGYQALFDSRLRDTDRVRVLLDMLGDHQIRLELRAGQIQSQRVR